MSNNKTVANKASVEDFINSLEDQKQAQDSRELVKIMQEISGETPVMWGPAIIGFGSYHYKYVSGREGDWAQIGFSPRKGRLSLYLTFNAAKLTEQFPDLGKYTIGKGCIYIKRLSDVNIEELRKLIAVAYAEENESPERSDGKEQLI
ncbi:DUF1801 domain-containing protein [Sedimentibacter sp.]|uniref:DUF1801 domain-containing protein n=1 Tax=Sedimentibacter sp. TaxID=1960295 RepID=UPI00289EDC74|nr:DUF1801 domain-containing protein [Sedimentibacter sp.]